MRGLLAVLAGTFALIPGITVIISGLGTPPDLKVVFGGVVEGFGILGLLVVVINRSRIHAMTTKRVSRWCIGMGAASFLFLLLYLVLYGYCVVTHATRGTVYFPLWETGELREIVTDSGGRAAAIEDWGRYAVYDAVQRTGSWPLLMTTAILLVVYLAIFSLLTVAFSFGAVY